MNVLTNLVKRNLILNKRRTIVTIISIILSCALIGGVATLIVSFQNFMQDIEREQNGNYHAVFNDVSIDKTKYIENNAYIEQAMESADLGYAVLPNAANTYKPYFFVTSFNKAQFENMPLHLVEGRLPSNSNEILISSHTDTTSPGQYKVGDTITLDIGNRVSSDGRILKQKDSYNDGTEGVSETLDIKFTHTYKIVGIVQRPSIESYNSPGYTAITYLDSDLLKSVSNINVWVIVKNPNGIYDKLSDIARINKLPEIAPDVYNIDYHNGLLRWYGVTDNDNANSMLYGFAAILITVIMIASIIVIYNSFNISITERKKQFGMLSSIGSTSKQIRNMVLKEGLLLSLIGIPLGIISSIVGIGITLQVINNLGIFEEFYNSRLDLTISPLSILVTIFFGGLTIFISSFIPAIKASKTSPIDAIRLTNDIKIKGKKLRTSKLTRKLFGVEGELAAKNMKRNRKKYRSTIISLFVSIILFMTVNAFAEYSFRSSLKVYNDYNFNVVASAPKEALERITKFDNIDKYSITNEAYMTLYVDENELNTKIRTDMKRNNYNEEKKKYMVTVKLSTLGNEEFARYAKEIGVDIKDYKNLNNPKAIIMDKSNYFDMIEGKYYQVTLTNYKVNDILNLEYDDLENDHIKKDITIGKITSTYPIGFSNVDSATQTIQAFITDEIYASLDQTLKDENTSMYIQSSNPSKLAEQIEKYSDDNKLDIYVENVDEAVQKLKNAVLAISIFLYGFISLVSLITITNVINTITTSIYLRRREFAMLKAVGMTDGSFNKMIRFESVFYGIKSLFYGLPLGIVIDYFMFKNTSELFIYDYELPYRPIFICVAFVFVIISITMAYSVRKIRNDNIIDVIKQENL